MALRVPPRWCATEMGLVGRRPVLVRRRPRPCPRAVPRTAATPARSSHRAGRRAVSLPPGSAAATTRGSASRYRPWSSALVGIRPVRGRPVERTATPAAERAPTRMPRRAIWLAGACRRGPTSAMTRAPAWPAARLVASVPRGRPTVSSPPWRERATGRASARRRPRLAPEAATAMQRDGAAPARTAARGGGAGGKVTPGG